ncbi:MAG: bifunctional chorismate mutase/prephenate dehydratase [Coriobacteriia bacterium]|nr:bifunctional chorismate mutase/prephenate dehydratase [Coriobacteriia bacterium]
MISPKEYRIEEFPQSAVVACQGVKGAYSQTAANVLFESPDVMYMRTFEGVCMAVDAGMCQYGILPIENSNSGSITDVYDLTRKYNFYIVRSVKISIQHMLLANGKLALGDITEIYTHSQAAKQCSALIERMPDAKLHLVENTAKAAQMVAESGRTDIAAIASENCVELYGLTVIEENIQNNANNYTRFICISKKCEVYGSPERISLMLTVDHKSGALFEVIKQFADLDLNLIKLESRPLPDTDFEFMFYFDVQAHIADEKVHELLTRLNLCTKYLAFLGNYDEIDCPSTTLNRQ